MKINPNSTHALAKTTGTGVAGLNEILCNELIVNRLYLVEGNPTSGKITFAIQSLLEGVKKIETVLHITLSETVSELNAVTISHDQTLDYISSYDLLDKAELDIDAEQLILYLSEIELGQTTKEVMALVDEIKPARMVSDSRSGLPILAQNLPKYRRQILASKYFFSTRSCSGAGKITTAIQRAVTAPKRGQRIAYYLCKKSLGIPFLRAQLLGMGIWPFIADGSPAVSRVNPYELSPRKAPTRARAAVDRDHAAFVVSDRLNAYPQAMPDEKFLVLQMHEIFSFSSQQGIITPLILGQYGMIGESRSGVDLRCLSDTIVVFLFFGSKGNVLTAISVVKNQTSSHERSIHKFRLSTHNGFQVVPTLQYFKGVLVGQPSYHGPTSMLQTKATHNGH